MPQASCDGIEVTPNSKVMYRDTMSPQYQSSDLIAELFLILRTAFFESEMRSRTYQLRDKRNTQDDPFDEYVYRLLVERLPHDTRCLKAPGPLITPDLVILRPHMCHGASLMTLATDLRCIVRVEVKKLERPTGSTIAIALGLDYNTTPPCGTLRIYDLHGAALDIRGFYLFVCQETVLDDPSHYRLSALALCDGNLLNADFTYYLSIVGPRTKEVGLGTYSDGANRSRPMLIFANPLGASALDHCITLVHVADNLEQALPQLRYVGRIKRTAPQEGVREFHCYRLRQDVPETTSTLLSWIHFLCRLAPL